MSVHWKKRTTIIGVDRKFPPRSLLCSVHGVKVVDSWSPESQGSGKKPKKSTEELNFEIAQDNLTLKQVSRAKDSLAHYFL